jgi:ribonuclease HII
MTTPWTITVAEEGLDAIAGPVVVAAILTPTVADAPVYHYRDLLRQPKSGGAECYEHVPAMLRPALLKDLRERVRGSAMLAYTGQSLIADAARRAAAYTVAVVRLLEREHLRNDVARACDYTIACSAPEGLAASTISGIPVIANAPKDWRYHTAATLARVRRDYFLALADREFPQYEFLDHRGYADPRHLRLIYKFGATRHHFRTGTS